MSEHAEVDAQHKQALNGKYTQMQVNGSKTPHWHNQGSSAKCNISHHLLVDRLFGRFLESRSPLGSRWCCCLSL